ncbi:hypothetical protein Tco_0953297 [Tanacetum coccineum]|uniref:Uncharacterized protein n=1 Tax=Tanacetum coccineum TaxID=301880 RepID=A0ABQ5E1S0_9ASTR
MAARKPTTKESVKKKTTPKADKPVKPAPAKQSKSAHGQAPVDDVAIREPASDLQKPKKKSIADQYIFQRRNPATHDALIGPSAQPEDVTSANVVHETPSPADAKTDADLELSVSEAYIKILNVGEEQQQGDEVLKTMTLKERTVDLNEGQAGSDPGKSVECRPPPEHEVMKEDQAGSNPRLSHVALVGPDPKPMHDDFVATNLDETLGDQFFNNKPTEEPGKANVETKVESIVTIPIHQASSTAPPLSTSIIDLSPPKLVSTPAQEPIVTATTATTTTTLLFPPPP